MIKVRWGQRTLKNGDLTFWDVSRPGRRSGGNIAETDSVKVSDKFAGITGVSESIANEPPGEEM